MGTGPYSSDSGYLTSGMVAKLCGVAQRTVCKWANAGILPHEIIPAVGVKAGHRRFRRDDVREFMKKTGFGLQSISPDSPLAVVAIPTPCVSGQVVSELRGRGCRTSEINHAFAVGYEIAATKPTLAVIDSAMFAAGPSELCTVVNMLIAKPNPPRIAAIFQEDAPMPNVPWLVDLAFRHPVNPVAIADWLLVARSH